MKSILKKIIIMTVLAPLAFLSFGQAIQVDCNNKVGINTAPISGYSASFAQPIRIVSGYSDLIFDYPGFYGPSILPEYDYDNSVGWSDKRLKYVYVWDMIEGSDQRLKENIRELSGALDLILKLNAIKYDIKKEFAFKNKIGLNSVQTEKIEADRKDHYGFLAQEVQKIIPEVVDYDDSTDSYGIEYTRIIPLLVQAMKEQQLIIESLQSEIMSTKLKSTSNTSEIIEINIVKESTLYQNSPNPFTESTKIEYYLTNEVQNAAIYIYDMNGAQLKSIPLHLKGYDNITINGNELKAGMYLYTLIADEKAIDTKRMILTD
jgi:hypothetical protein